LFFACSFFVVAFVIAFVCFFFSFPFSRRSTNPYHSRFLSLFAPQRAFSFLVHFTLQSVKTQSVQMVQRNRYGCSPTTKVPSSLCPRFAVLLSWLPASTNSALRFL
jgi:hypothetical protein